jgi:hypothetical protein
MHVTNSAEAADMKLLDSSSIPAQARSGTLAGLVRADMPEPPRLTARPLDSPSGPRPAESFDRVARLAAMILGTSLASVTVAGFRSSSNRK